MLNGKGLPPCISLAIVQTIPEPVFILTLLKDTIA
jgi:hypothetical protein